MVAQWLEQLTESCIVMGSSPTYRSCSISFYYFHFAEGHICVVCIVMIMDNTELIPHTSIGLHILE